jgi:hypothetical protein
MPYGSVIVTAKRIAGHDAVGERREPGPGRSGCCRCPLSGSRSGDRHQHQDHPVSRTLAGGHARERRGRNRPPRSRTPGRRGMLVPGASVSLFRHHAERRGRSGRTRAREPVPPIWSAAWLCRRPSRTTPKRAICAPYSWPDGRGGGPLLPMCGRHKAVPGWESASFRGCWCTDFISKDVPAGDAGDC